MAENKPPFRPRGPQRGVPFQKEYGFRINGDIRVPEVRIVGDNLAELIIDEAPVETGIYPIRQALKMAETVGIDLVEISPNAVPPVCRLIDVNKFVYEKEKKEKALKAKAVKAEIKEIRFGPNTDDHDFDFKAKHAIEFLKEGNKVKAYVQFKGRAWRPGPVLSGAFATMRARPWTIGILGVVTARSAVIGFLDVLLVVLAFEELDLGSGGPGVLSALVGAGALASTFVAAAVVRRTRLAPWLAVGLGLAAVGCLALAAVTALAVTVVVLPVLGLTAAVLYGLGTILLQR